MSALLLLRQIQPSSSFPPPRRSAGQPSLMTAQPAPPRIEEVTDELVRKCQVGFSLDSSECLHTVEKG
jgi:hypothetical protein